MKKIKNSKKSKTIISTSLAKLTGVLFLLTLGLFLVINLYKTINTQSLDINEIKPTSTRRTPEMWFMATGKATYNRELPTDHLQLWNNPEEWVRSRRVMDVFFFSWKQTQTQAFNPKFLKEKVIPLLAENNIKIGLDTGFATWLSCRRQGPAAIQYDIDNINKIKAAGGTVSYITLQSALGKATPDNLKDECPNYSFEDRVADIATYVKTIHAQYPDIKIGLVDATAAHIIRNQKLGEPSYQDKFTKLQTVLDAQGQSLSFFLLDTSVEAAEGLKHPGVLEYDQIRQLELFVQRKLRAKFGIIVTSSEGGMNDPNLYLRRILSFINTYQARGGDADFYMSESWHRYPEKALPESGGQITLTNVFLRLANKAKGVSQ